MWSEREEVRLPEQAREEMRQPPGMASGTNCGRESLPATAPPAGAAERLARHREPNQATRVTAPLCAGP